MWSQAATGTRVKAAVFTGHSAPASSEGSDRESVASIGSGATSLAARWAPPAVMR